MKYQMSILRDLVYGAAARGVNFHLLCEKVGIKPDTLNEAEQLIDWETAPYLWDYIVELSGDEFAGLHMGQEVRPSVFGILGHLLQTCRNLQQVLEAIVKYGNTWSEIFQFSIQKNGSFVYFYFEPILLYSTKYPISARQSTDIALSGTLRLFYILSGRNTYPQKLYLAYPKKDSTPYQKICQCEINFNAAQSYFIFHQDQLKVPVLSHDRSLFFLFNGLLEQKQKHLENENTFAEQVQRILITEFKGQIPPIDVMASRLCLNTRSFQRKLSAENTTYRKVCQSLQKQLSWEMMKDRNKKIDDVALLMGYADHTTFRRAFNKWHATTAD
jgi:AraC-like DNA-binding protein